MGGCLLIEVMRICGIYVCSWPRDMYSIARNFGLCVHYLPRYGEMICFLLRDHRYQTLLRVPNVDEAWYFPGFQCMSRAKIVHWLRTDGMKALYCVNRASTVQLLVDNFRRLSRHRVISMTVLTTKVAHTGLWAIWGYEVKYRPAKVWQSREAVTWVSRSYSSLSKPTDTLLYPLQECISSTYTWQLIALYLYTLRCTSVAGESDKSNTFLALLNFRETWSIGSWYVTHCHCKVLDSEDGSQSRHRKSTCTATLCRPRH